MVDQIIISSISGAVRGTSAAYAELVKEGAEQPKLASATSSTLVSALVAWSQGETRPSLLSLPPTQLANNRSPLVLNRESRPPAQSGRLPLFWVHGIWEKQRVLETNKQSLILVLICGAMGVAVVRETHLHPETNLKILLLLSIEGYTSHCLPDVASRIFLHQPAPLPRVPPAPTLSQFREFQRPLSDNELSYFLPSRAEVSMMYFVIHLDIRSAASLITRDRLAIVWAITRLRHTLLASRIILPPGQYDKAYFFYIPPYNPTHALNEAKLTFSVYRDRTIDQHIESFMNDKRPHLSWDQLSSYAFIPPSHPVDASSSKVEDFTLIFFTLALTELLDHEWSRRWASHTVLGFEPVTSPTEARMPSANSRLQAAAHKVEFLKNQETFIGGHHESRVARPLAATCSRFAAGARCTLQSMGPRRARLLAGCLVHPVPCSGSRPQTGPDSDAECTRRCVVPPWSLPPPPTMALVGLTLLGDLDDIYPAVAYPDFEFGRIASFTRKTKGKMLLLAHTFRGKFFIQLGVGR
ncbi:hypothetical protein BS47DRAFT_1402780 [Hydnum rufescens UP504]|uniref:Uncharacterized protein n=1 Tax=Hydnum rufescens UP504 TaxID=1448309 RepID=A0A9P6DLH4_9AGAM|nr:hypothetical protein BS47DRAFT_1402780 [Hydnum rufescens UP504]